MYKTPFKFLFIRFTGWRTYVWVTPTVISVVLVSLILWFPGGVKISGPDGLFGKLISILPVTGGFFVASLTVVMAQNQGVILGQFSGKSKPTLSNESEPITRQRFLALLFGYLATSSFCMLILLSLAELFKDAALDILIQGVYNSAKIILIVGIVFWVCQMASITIIGLHYLTDRLYRSDQVAKFRKPLPPAE